MKKMTKVKVGAAITGLACLAGATAAVILLQKKREEEIYHEAELKAMDELEEMMREGSDNASFSGVEEGADASYPDDEQTAPEQNEEKQSEEEEE